MRYISILLIAFIFIGCANNVDTPNYMEMKPKKETIKNNGYTNAKYKVTIIYTYNKERTVIKYTYITTINDDGTVYHKYKFDIPNANEWKVDILYSTDKCGWNEHLINIDIVNSNGKSHPQSKKMLEEINIKKDIKDFIPFNLSNIYMCRDFRVGDRVGVSQMLQLFKKLFTPMLDKISYQKIKPYYNFDGSIYFGTVKYNHKKYGIISLRGDEIELKTNNVKTGDIKISGFLLLNPTTGMVERGTVKTKGWMLINDEYQKMNLEMKIAADKL